MNAAPDLPSLDQLERSVRVLALLDALARAGVDPVPLRVLHELAYLANVLAPVFDLEPFNASLLKRRGGPYYPELQDTVDELIGKGMVEAEEIRYVLVEEEGRYRLDANYRLNYDLAASAVLRYRNLFGTDGETTFIDELAAAYSTLSDDQLGRVVAYDAKYADADVDVNDVIDFGQWKSSANNFSRNAALSFRPQEKLQPAERLYMYLEQVQRRARRAS